MPSPKIQPIHVDDLIGALMVIATRKNIHQRILCLASLSTVSFTQFLLIIASTRIRRFRIPVPVPIVLIKILGASMGERLRSRFGLNQLNSLFDLPLMETESTLLELGLSLRSLESGMHPSGNNKRRKLFREGYTLLFYILKLKPPYSVLRRYVQVIEQLRNGRSMNLPPWVLNWPKTLALLDDPTFIQSTQGTELAWRLNAATVLAEASIQGAQRFLGSNQRANPVVRLIFLFKIIAAETIWRFLRFFCSLILYFFKSVGAL